MNQLRSVAVGFNTEIGKALDANEPLHRRFGALRSAVQRFSPNGFNATFRNLELAAEVSDPDSWTAGEVERAAALLRDSRLRYRANREAWDQTRRTRKAQGLRQPGDDEREGFGDESWCDGISFTGIRRPRYRWIGLADWVEAHQLDPGPVGHDLEAELQRALHHVPAARFAPHGSMLAHYGPFPSWSEPANIIAIPYRIYGDPPTDAEYLALPIQQRTLLDCWYSRSHDGHIRQRHLKRLLPVEEYWAIPYVIAALGDYVIEIVHEVEAGLKQLSEPDSWHYGAYRQFATNNHDFIELMRQRATSYWNCYYPRSHSRTGGASPKYPAFSILDELQEAGSYPRHWRAPNS